MGAEMATDVIIIGSGIDGGLFILILNKRAHTILQAEPVILLANWLQ
jgi:hypothetical protein